jgi:hypothetical protein
MLACMQEVEEEGSCEKKHWVRVRVRERKGGALKKEWT